MADCFQVTTTLPDEAAAQRMATLLVQERLAACAQILGPIASTYRWQGTIEQSSEWYCNLKTTRNRLIALRDRILQLHSYEVPEIIALPIEEGNPQYLRWIEEVVGVL